MKSFAKPILLMLFLILFNSFFVLAQEENTTIANQGSRYVSLKIRSLDKYNSRIEHQQDRLLKKLKKKEKHFAHKLKNTDSLAYAHYKHQPSPSYDSINKISKSDTGTTAIQFASKKNATIDSLRGVQKFVESKSGLSTNAPQAQGTSADLNKVQSKLNFRNYITQLITQRTNALKSIAGSDANLPGLKGIEKQVFYGKAKMKVFKEMEDEPTKAEDKAMDYLQGTEGFDKAMSNATDGGAVSMQSIGSGGGGAADLQKMGFQNKAQMQTNLQNKFGSGLGAIGKQAGDGFKQWQNQAKEITGSANSLKQGFGSLKNTGKPTFKVNPMRGLPFWKRVEKQYGWQATHASSDGKQPAIVEPSVMLGFKHTPKLTYGLGAAADIGLGQNWQSIHFSFQGLGLRTFAAWKWQYGIGAYVGYERMYKQFAFTKKKQNPATDIIPTPHSTANYSESLLIGLTKTYKMNKKYNGAMQLLYDVWWQQKGLQSPIVLRFTTVKN